MEALVALSVAAAVVQFLYFSSKLVSKGQQLHHSANGPLIENKEMEDASRRLQAFTEPLLISEGDDAIKSICKTCVTVSSELTARLVKLQVPTAHPHKRWKSFRQALKTVWTRNEIKETKNRLECLRAELNTHVTLTLRDKVTAASIRQDARFNSLDTATRQIMEALLDLPRTIRQGMDNQFQHLARSEHSEHSRTREVLMDHAKTQLHDRVCHAIIESLHFPTRTVRHDYIPEAHKQTFEWIFRDPVANEKPWSHFGQWLETGSGIYWINGKAGSGKSTLMKFIVDHDNTRQLLGAWAQGTDLETPSFFFWKNGHEDQRSQEGLLRSLLYDVLRKHPALVPNVFPDLWARNYELASHNISQASSTWTLTKLKQAFALLVSFSTIRICFFVDGLDEYEGDHDELAGYFAQLSCGTSVKLCISSRPCTAFQDALRNCAELRLQDLTYDDIKRYVNDKVIGDPRMLSLKQREPRRTKQLMDSLIGKSDGVFLWATLVVKSLLRRLTHRNDLDTLEKRLNSMPPELEMLYGHMFSSIDSHEKEKGSKIFELFKACNDEKDLELIYFSLKEFTTAGLSSSLAISRQIVKVAQHSPFDFICKEMDILLQACCGGLFEIIIMDSSDYIERIGKLSFIHSTVEDYLATPDTWNKIISHTSDPSWNPHMNLLQSTVMCLENRIQLGLGDSTQSRTYIKRHWDYLTDQINISLRLEALSHNIVNIQLDNFDRAASTLADCNSLNQSHADTEFSHWSSFVNLPTLPRQDIVELAATYGLWFYVKSRLEGDPSLTHKLQVPLLAHALLQTRPWGIFSENIFKTVAVILSFYGDPNESLRGHSIWQYWISILHITSSSGFVSKKSRLFLKLTTIEMIKAGAELGAVCVKGKTSWQDLYQEFWAGDRFQAIPVSYPFVQVSDLINHSWEGWRDLQENSSFCNRERSQFAGRENLAFEERHCLKSVIEDFFRKDDPESADEILQLIERLEAEKRSVQSEVPIRERKRKKGGRGFDMN